MNAVTEMRPDRSGAGRLRTALALLAVLLATAAAASGEVRAQDGGGEPQPPQEGESQVSGKAVVPPGSAPQTLRKAVWAVREHKGVSMFPWYRHLGVGIVQKQARWDEIAASRPGDPKDPDDPAYRWPRYLEELVADAERWEMEVMIQLIGVPGWANGGRSWEWAPVDETDFRDFATAIARRYPSVDLWMVWGEPNRKESFRPFTGADPEARKLTRTQQEAPRNYARLVDSAYEGLKSVDYGNLVIGGNTYFSGGKTEIIRPYPWIRYMKLSSGRRPRMDMWGHNPYSYRKPDLDNPPSPKGRVDFSDLRRLTKALDRTFPRPRLPLFLSEFGVPTAPDTDFKFSVKPRKSRKWVRAAFRIVRRWERIYTLGWAIPVDTERNPQGLLDADLSPKPAYNAFKNG